MKTANGVKGLIVYQKAFAAAIEIHQISKNFPQEEKYLLIDQLIRSSRSICACLGEGYRKKRYKKYYISKIVDADGECAEVQVWLDFALACSYINQTIYNNLYEKYEEIGRMLGGLLDRIIYQKTK